MLVHDKKGKIVQQLQLVNFYYDFSKAFVFFVKTNQNIEQSRLGENGIIQEKVLINSLQFVGKEHRKLSGTENGFIEITYDKI